MSPVERMSQTMRSTGIEPVTASPTLRGLVWLFRFIFALVVDGWEGLSLTRFIAIEFAGLVAYSVIKSGGRISGNALFLAIISASIAFGKSTFTFFLRKWRGESSSVDMTADVTYHTDAPLRDPDRGIQPTP